MRNAFVVLGFALVAVFIVNAWGNIVLESKTGDFTPPNKNVFAQRMFDGVDSGTSKKTADCWILPKEEWGGLDINCQLFIEAYYKKEDQFFERESNRLAKEYRNPFRFIYPVNVTANRLVRFIELDMEIYGKLKCALIDKNCNSVQLIAQSKKDAIFALMNKILRFIFISGLCGVLLPVIAMCYVLGEQHIKFSRQNGAEGVKPPTLKQTLNMAEEKSTMLYAAIYGSLINILSWVAISTTLN